jgi:hypothetical protein
MINATIAGLAEALPPAKQEKFGANSGDTIPNFNKKTPDEPVILTSAISK